MFIQALCIHTFTVNFFRKISSGIVKMSTPSEIKTFIFLDTETTGLPRDENNRTKITELCMVAVQASHISQGVFPRVQNKLSFCFNPWKLISVEAEKITGLSNNLLEHQCSFSAETVNCINSFLNQNSKPICFVGHNANNFDYPILRREIEKTGCSLIDGVLCIDSINTFRDLHLEEVEARQSEGSSSHSVPLEFTAEYDQILCNTVEQLESGMSQTVVDAKRRNETTPIKHKTETATFSEPTPKKFKVMPSKLQLNFDISFRLGDVYTRLTKNRPTNEHRAEGDVLMLLTCAATLGDKFVDWSNSNAKNFCDIPPMVPGKNVEREIYPVAEWKISQVFQIVISSTSF